VSWIIIENAVAGAEPWMDGRHDDEDVGVLDALGRAGDGARQSRRRRLAGRPVARSRSGATKMVAAFEPKEKLVPSRPEKATVPSYALGASMHLAGAGHHRIGAFQRTARRAAGSRRSDSPDPGPG